VLLASILLLEGASAEIIPPAVPSTQMDAAMEAKNLFERGNYRKAEEIYGVILKAAPDNLYVLSNLGLTQFRQQKLKEAEATFKKALVIEPMDESASPRSARFIISRVNSTRQLGR
jgi:tetratricopeptide (TPR) repeat protein